MEGTESKEFFQNLAGKRRIGLAFCLAHQLTDQKAKNLLFSLSVLLGGIRVFFENFSGSCLQRAGVIDGFQPCSST